MKYFNDSDLFELFEFNYDSKKCETLDMLIEKDGFNVKKTPTLDKHMEFLNNLNMLTGLSLNSNLYSKAEEPQTNAAAQSRNQDKFANVDQLSNSTDEDKLSA